MKTLEWALIILAFVFLSINSFFIWENYISPKVTPLNPYTAQVKEYPIYEATQFYPNMRYPSREINFFIDDSCNQKKKEDILLALKILESSTILKFKESYKNPEIEYSCAPLEEDVSSNHFIVGEGGPITIINTTLYNVILKGKVLLYKEERCKKPVVTIHETLHALGFNHTSKEKSILYPFTSCDQEIDPEIIETINELYAAESLSDLSIESVNATRVGNFLFFEITIANIGLKDNTNSTLIIYSNEKEIKTIPVGTLELGKKKIFAAKNILLFGKISSITFSIKTEEKELSKKNNEITLYPKNS